MGTPEFAIPTLERLCARYPVVGVVTQPDRPAGRGRELAASPVKQFALAEGIPVFQPEKLRHIEAVERVRTWAPDLIVVAAFGQLLSKTVLALPRLGCLNVHASLLPRWRGAAPIQTAILAGDEITGVTIMQMDPGLDTGPILAMHEVMIGSEETGGELEDQLAQVGADLLMEILPSYLAGIMLPRPQPEEGVTLAPRFEREAAKINWEESAVHIARQIRAFAPQPGAYTFWNGQMLKILAARALPTAAIPPEATPGTVFVEQGGPAIVTGEGALALIQLQMAGKRPMSGDVFMRGQRAFLGAVLRSN